VSIHPAFKTYAAALVDYGYEDLSFLQAIDEEDFAIALTAAGMTKQGHQAMACKRFRQLCLKPLLDTPATELVVFEHMCL
jgi:hypothetical protein